MADGYCPHGVYVGGIGIDWMCGRCESGDTQPDRYVVIENTPGYLPEDDDPFVTEDYSAAVDYLNERAKEYEEGGPMGDGNYTVHWGIASSANFAAVLIQDNDRTHDLGRYIGIERYED